MNNGYVWKGPTFSSDGTNSVDFTSGFGYVASPKKTREYQLVKALRNLSKEAAFP